MIKPTACLVDATTRMFLTFQKEKTMKTLSTAALAAITVAATIPALALADDSNFYTSSSNYSWDDDSWLQKSVFGYFEAFGGVWDFVPSGDFKSSDEVLSGGGLSLGFDVVSKEYLIGAGARSGFGFWVGSLSDYELDFTDFTWDIDVMLELRLTDFLTLYGGVGITYHIMEADGVVESYNYYRSGRYRRYHWEEKTVTWETESSSDNHAWFVGARFRLVSHFFIFVEYRKTRGTLELTTDELSYNSALRTIKVDLNSDCYIGGIGLLF